MKRTVFFLALCAITLMSGCGKNLNLSDDTCDKIKRGIIHTDTTSYFAGDDIHLTTVQGDNIFYNWSHTGMSGAPGNFSSYTVESCRKEDEGWYYLTVSSPQCTSHRDSLYIKVVNKPVVAPCSPTNNQVSFSGIPGISFSSAEWSFDASNNSRNLRGYQSYGYPDINVYFHHYWNDKEPEDGEYSFSNFPTFTGQGVYTVFLGSLYQSTWYIANTGKLYVSHVNGKIRVTFCNVNFSGQGNGYSFSGSGRLTAP